MKHDHDWIEELLSAQALDALEPDEERELRETLADHGPACDVCARLERELGETAALLALTLEPVPVETSAARVLELAGEPPAEPPSVFVVADGDEERRLGRGELGQRRSRRWPVLVAAAAVVVTIAVVAANVIRRPVEVTSADLAGQTVRFAPAGETEGSLVMAHTPGQSGAVLWGRDLPDPPEGHSYEIWMIEDETPTRGACVEPLDGRIVLFLDADLGTSESMAVTVESSDCPAEPSGPVVFSAQLA